MGKSLRTGHTKSCGCYKKEKASEQGKKNSIDITNLKVGKLTAIKPLYSKKGVQKTSNVVWECKCECGNITEVTAAHLKSGHTQSCGRCNFSKGEMKIEQLLIENQIPYEAQKEFENCIFPSGRKAKFDFYINNSYIIEYDGEQHFDYRENNLSWNTKEQYEKTKERDNIKNEYCFKKGIPIIRIPYQYLNKLSIKDLELSTSKFIMKG